MTNKVIQNYVVRSAREMKGQGEGREDGWTK